MAEKQTKVVRREPKKKKIVVRVDTPVLNIRKGPGFENETMGFIPIGEHEIEEVDGGFGKLKSGDGWIFLACTKPVKKKEEKNESEAKSSE